MPIKRKETTNSLQTVKQALRKVEKSSPTLTMHPKWPRNTRKTAKHCRRESWEDCIILLCLCIRKELEEDMLLKLQWEPLPLMILRLADFFKGVSCPNYVVRYLKPYITSKLITTFQKTCTVDFFYNFVM